MDLKKNKKKFQKKNFFENFFEPPEIVWNFNPGWSRDHAGLYGTFLQQLECGYEFPALIHAWIASAGVLEWFISTSGEAYFE